MYDFLPEQSFISSYLGGKGKGWETLNLSQHPTHVIMDLGSTRAMGSRPAITKFIAEWRRLGHQAEFLQSNATFNFANSKQPEGSMHREG